MLTAGDLKTGVIFKEGNTPYKVERFELHKSARSGATIRLRIRNLLDGSLAERSYAGSDLFPEADIFKKSMQFLYKDVFYVFMDPVTYEQVELSEDVVGNTKNYLKENENYVVMYFEDSPVSVESPITMNFEVTYTEPGFKGNTVSNALKDATLSNGLIVKVPPFIKIGDVIKIDTRTEEYISRA
jgi:elongation factor P